jgi:hypothetical protein
MRCKYEECVSKTTMFMYAFRCVSGHGEKELKKGEELYACFSGKCLSDSGCSCSCYKDQWHLARYSHILVFFILFRLR